METDESFLYKNLLTKVSNISIFFVIMKNKRYVYFF